MTRITSSVYLRRLGHIAGDAALVAAAYVLAYVLRFDEGIPARYEELLLTTLPFVVAGKVALFAVFGLYNKVWRFIDGRDLEAIVRTVVIASLALVGSLFLLSPTDTAPPRGVIALDFLLTLAFVAGARLLVRAVLERPSRAPLAHKGSREVLVVGAGNGGQSVAFELRRNP